MAKLQAPIVLVAFPMIGGLAAKRQLLVVGNVTLFLHLAYDQTPPTDLMLTASNLVWLLFGHGGLKVVINFSKV